MSDENDTPARPRTSRFKEHTNTNSSIRPPPDELWKDLGIESLIEKFNEENQRPAVLRKTSGNSAASHGERAVKTLSEPTTHEAHSVAKASAIVGVPSATALGDSTSAPQAAPAPAASEGTFGRFRNAFASVFGGVLGKRKAGNVDAEKEKEKEKEKQILDQRKKAADAAYQEAKELGLLPTPKVFVRPSLAAKSHKCVADEATPNRPPRTPRLYHTPSKKDLQKQKKLSKRVSDLEFKLASARKELQSVLHNDNLPPVPPLPTVLPPTPTTSHSEHEPEVPKPTTDVTPAVSPSPAAVPSSPVRAPVSPIRAPTSPARDHHPVGKITKKRKATTIDDAEYKPIPTDSEGDTDMLHSASEPEHASDQRTVKRVKPSASRKNLKRQSTRLQKRGSRKDLKAEEPVTVVPDGVSVPMIPAIPKGVKGKKVQIGDDGYGGLEHEMF